MAYSDYGGYGYRNGERVIERSDCTITPEGDTFGTPGSWPGFAMIAAGMPQDEVKKRLEWPSGHVVLGDGPIYVVLRKQSYVGIYRGPEPLNMPDLMKCDDPDAIETWKDKAGKAHKYVNNDYFLDRDIPCVFEVDGCKVEVVWTYEDNYYQYVRLTQSDGVIWTGWSGYGVGAGLEDADYGFSTARRESRIRDIFPDKRVSQ